MDATTVELELHGPATAVPMALAALHRDLAVGTRVRLGLFDTGVWSLQRIGDVVEGAGFTDLDIEPAGDGPDEHGGRRVDAVRARTLADTVGPGMRLLVVGLNPSLNAADAGVGFFKNGNRFWPAALAAGLVTRDRDPVHALGHHGVGMTDIVKRATARADELAPEEFRSGMARLERLVAWLRPRTVCCVGLVGWRTAVDRKAAPGVQPGLLGGRPVYVMPSTSGLNARTSLDELTTHLRAASTLADPSS